MKYSFKSKVEQSEIICYIVIIVATLLAIVANTISPINQPNQYNTQLYELFSNDWWKSMFGIFIFDIFVFYCIYLISSKRINYKKWRKKLIDNGIKIDGKVIEIRYVKSNIYRLRVSYFSNILQKESIFEIPEICIENLDTDKKIKCDVYEIKNLEKKHDYDSDMFKISGNTISISANPIKLFVTVHKKYTDKNFGFAHAENFRYDDNDK